GTSWGSTGRSPPASGNAWGAAALSSSPPANSGPWGSRSNVSTTRPSSGGSGTRPSTAGSDHSHEPATPNAWGSASSRPSSASGALGMVHAQSTITRPCSAESRPITRPCSAESRPGSSYLSRFADSSVESSGPWAGSGTAQKLGENQPQPAQFSLTSGDFPSLGSDKNAELRPHQGNASNMPSMSTSEGLAQKERSQPSPPDWRDEVSTGKEKRPREMSAPDEGHPPKEGFHRQTFVRTKDSWRYDDGHRNCTPSNQIEDEWCRGGPPVGPYGTPAGQGRFPFTPPGYIRPTFDYGPVPYAQRPPGSGGYGRHGEMYGPYVAQPMVAGRPGVPLGHSMYPNQLPFDGYYGPPGVPGSKYGNLDEREMAMMRMGGGPGMYGGYPHNQGLLVDGPQYRHNGPGAGIRPVALHPLTREQNDLSYSRVTSEGTDKAYPKQADVWMSKDVENCSDNNRPLFSGNSNTRRNSVYSTSSPQSESDNSRAAPSGHRNWGTVNSDEQMDFSKPVFDEDALSSREFTDGRISGTDSNFEKGANVTSIAEQSGLGNKKNIQVKSKDGMDSCESSVFEDLNQARKRDCVEIDPNKVVHLLDHGQTGLEQALEVDVLPKDEKKILATVVVEKVHEKDFMYGEKGVSKEKIEASSTSKNHALCQETQALVTPLKGLDPQGLMDGPKIISVAAAPSSERHSALNTSLKIKGGLSTAAGLNNSSHETNKIRDKVQLLKRSDNHPTDNTLDTDEAMLQVHSTQGAKVIQEPLQRESHTIRGRFSAHEGDSEWRKKVPVAESATKAVKPNSTHVNRQVIASSMTGSVIIAPENSGDKSVGESNAQQSSGSHDYEAQRAWLKEAAAQRAKQLQREEEERIKEQKAKALLKLEELNRRASGVATPQDVENHKIENIAPVSGSVISEAVQQHQPGSYGNKASVVRHDAIDNLESDPGDNFAADKHLGMKDHRDQLNVGKQNDSPKGEDGVPIKNATCEVPTAEVSAPSETAGNLGKNVSDMLVKSGKNDRGKRENHRKSSNVIKEDPKYQMKMDDLKSLSKERENPPNISSLQNAPVLPMQVEPVCASILTSPSTSEVLQKDTALTGSDPSLVADQLNQPDFPKQARSRQKSKHYVLEQKSYSAQPSTLEKTEQVVSPDSGNSVNLAGESDVLQAGSRATVEKSSETIASSCDGGPISRKKKNSRNTKGKNKIDRPIVVMASAGSPEYDHSVTVQSNIIYGDLKHEGVGSSNIIQPVDKGVDMQDRKSERASVRNGGNDVNVAQDTWDAPAVDRGILQSTDDTSTGRVTHVKPQSAKRSYRGSQEARVSDKSQGSEGRVWAPVRAANHLVTTNDKQKLDQTELQSSGALNSEVVVQNPIRNRRAEIERYVPKPVAKEQAQHQENCQHPVAGSSFSARDQMDHRNIQQATDKSVVSSETRQPNLSIGENKGHIAGKQGKQNSSWRQRNSNEIRENSKLSHAHQGIEVVTALPLQIDEVTVSKTRQVNMESQGFQYEEIEIHPQLHQPAVQKSGHVECLPKSVSVQSHCQQVSQCEADQITQPAPVPHLQTSNTAKGHDAQLASKRDQNMHEQRFYQANRSRPKSQKISTRQVHIEGNDQFTRAAGVSEDGDKNHYVEQTFSHQRSRSSTWTPKLQGSADCKDHHLHQKPVSVGETDIQHVKIDSHEEHHDFERQSVQQTRAPAYLKTVCDQQEGRLSSAKKQHLQGHSSWQLPVSPHQFEGKNKSPNPDVVRLQTDHLSQQQSKSNRPDRQAAEKEHHKQTVNSASYQQRRQSGQGHWQQTGANPRFGTRIIDGNEEHSRSAIVQNSKQHDTTIPKNSESSYGAGQHHRQDTNKKQPLIYRDPIKQNLQVHSQAIPSEKPEFYQPKAGLTSGNGDNNEINHGTAPHGGSSWAGEHRGSYAYRDRDYNHARRGRSGGRGGGGSGLRGNESGSKIEHPSKQRLLVDATGGASPHQVAG
ncbi:hypothetical protein KI387_023660, partial [Taxus chinensis]